MSRVTGSIADDVERTDCRGILASVFLLLTLVEPVKMASQNRRKSIDRIHPNNRVEDDQSDDEVPSNDEGSRPSPAATPERAHVNEAFEGDEPQPLDPAPIAEGEGQHQEAGPSRGSLIGEADNVSILTQRRPSNPAALQDIAANLAPPRRVQPAEEPERRLEPAQEPERPAEQPPRRFQPAEEPARRFEPANEPPRRFQPANEPPRRFQPANEPPRRFQPAEEAERQGAEWDSPPPDYDEANSPDNPPSYASALAARQIGPSHVRAPREPQRPPYPDVRVDVPADAPVRPPRRSARERELFPTQPIRNPAPNTRPRGILSDPTSLILVIVTVIALIALVAVVSYDLVSRGHTTVTPTEHNFDISRDFKTTTESWT